MLSCAARELRLLRREIGIALVLGAIVSLACSGMAFADSPPPSTTQPDATTPITTATALTEPTTTSAVTTTTTQSATGASATATVTTATTSAAQPPRADACAGAGMLLLVPPSGAPRTLGPAVSARVPAGEGATTFQYPADGSVLRGVAPRADISGCMRGAEAETATSTVRELNLFGGAVRAARVAATLAHTAPAGSVSRLRVSVRGLLVEGHPASPRLRTQVKVGNWGLLLLDGAQVARSSPSGLAWWRAGLELRLTRAHAGLASGTELLIAYVAANRSINLVAPRPKPRPRRQAKAAAVGAPLTVTPPLKGGPYVFPVAGDVEFTDTYAAFRSDVPGGWHHGDDLFSGIGSPVVAVADGIVFSVGWNRLGGWRLWLQDRQGNDFYYAHLSGYTKLARDGERVKAGQPLAFVGNTGDAITTPHHLHFEIHPVSLLRLGYDGAVDPTSYLETWKHLSRVVPLAPVRLPAGAALHGDGALSDYRQLLATRGIRPARRHRAPAARPRILDPDPLGTLLPNLSAAPAVPSQARSASRQTAIVAAFAAFISVAALLLRVRIRAFARRLRAAIGA